MPSYSAYHVNGEMQTARREREMRAFREAVRGIMSNARCLTEGVDVPAVDVVAFLSPRKSKVDIVQAAGRAMRTAPGKETGYVLLLLFLETQENETIEEALARTDFEEAWDVLQAMQEQDEVLAEIIREMREEQGRLGGFDDGKLREKVEVLGPDVSLEVLRSAVSTALVDRLSVAWDERYGELERYKERFGDCNVPRKWQENPELGAWVVNQRRLENQGKLSSARKTRLDGLRFEWDLFDFRWEATLAELRRYKERIGDCNVPDRWPENPNLATWVQHQRDHKRSGRLKAERVRRLEDLDFDWDPDTTIWETKFAELKSYGEANGHCHVKRRENQSLAMWVGTQRKLLSRGRLDPERVKRLRDLGLEWDPLTAAWNSMFAELERYKEKFGECNVAIDGPENHQLATWVNTQRKAKIKGKLDPERTAKLTELGLEWHPHATAWETRFTELTRYKERFGDCNVPGQWPENPRLATWVGTQRNLKKEGELDPARVRRLQGLGFEWDLLTAGWESMFAELQLYREKQGHCDVPARWPDNPRLAAWVSTQRHRRSKDKLSAERIHRLEALSFNWASSRGSREGFDSQLELSSSLRREVIAYHEAGHAVISMKLGYRCHYVTVVPDGNRLGHACCEDPLIGQHDQKIEHALQVLIAARLAEGKHTGSRDIWSDVDDRVKATNIALLATNRDTDRAEAMINKMISETRKLVEQYWADIEALAQRLLIEGRVNFGPNRNC